MVSVRSGVMVIGSIHWVFNGLNLGVESRFLCLSPLNPKLSVAGKRNPSDRVSLREAGAISKVTGFSVPEPWTLTAALGTYQRHGLSYPAQLARLHCS
jgi:hypothetical protein